MKSIILALSLITFVSSQAQANQDAKVEITSPLPSENVYAAAVPEPSRSLLLVAGIAGLVVRRRR